MTAAALASILTSCRDEGIPSSCVNRNELRAARDMECNELTPYGPIASSINCVGKEGDAVSIPTANPFAYLWKAVKYCAAFAAFLEQRLHPAAFRFGPVLGR